MFERKFLAGLDFSVISTPSYTSSRLCKRCIALPLWSATCGFKSSPAELQERANKDGCSLCALLFQGIQARANRHCDSIRFAKISSYITVNDNGQDQPIANLYTTPSSQNTTFQDIQVGFPRQPVAGSTTHLKILREWIRCCDSIHQCYPKQLSFLPTRLLDTSDSAIGTVRLVEHSQGLCSEPSKYIALSHCWGSLPQHTRFCTFKSNIEELRQGIHITQLPKTFQDAVHITHGLGLQRLWIDSLCIIQDDADDWDAESKLMERVFSSAYCTIAASCASGSSDGFLKPRPERKFVTMQKPSQLGPYYVCETIDNFHRDVDQSELNQRGWVLQERALSRRTIYFTETQSYWECGGGVRCETMTKMKNLKASFLGDANFPHSAEKYVKGMKIELFQDLYERYTKLALSFPSDRPTAIKGLESRLLATFATTGGYGVFDRYLHRCLLWQRSGLTLKRVELSGRGKKVPSWSWMAYDGPICYMNIPFGKASWCNDITSSFSKVEEPDALYRTSPYIQGVFAPMLELEAPVWEIVDTQGGQMFLDELHRTFSRPLQCVIIGKSKTDPSHGQQIYYVLLVHFAANTDESQVYERVGVGILNRHHIALDSLQKKGRIR